MSERPARADESVSAMDTEEFFSLLANAHMLDVIYKVSVGGEPPVRFNDLQEDLGLSPNTLSRRLDELVAAGFLIRTSYDEIPPRVEYEPTERLYALEPMFRKFGAWLAEYGDDEGFSLPEE